MKTRAILIGSSVFSSVSLVFFATEVPFLWQTVMHQWKPSIDTDLLSLSGMALLLFVPLLTIVFLRRHTEERRQRLGIWTFWLAIASLGSIGLSSAVLTIFHYIPAHQVTDHIIIVETSPNTADRR